MSILNWGLHMAPEISFNQHIVIGMILALIVALNFLIAWTIFKKNKPNFKPMNIFLANYFVGIGFLSLSGMIVTISKDKGDIGQICPKEFLRYFFNINNICGVTFLQMIWKNKITTSMVSLSWLKRLNV